MDFLCEHVVERKKEGLYRYKYAAIISLFIIIPTIIVIVCMAAGGTSPNLMFLRWSIFLIPLFMFIGLKFGPIAAAYGRVAYEYSISSGEMSLAKIYGDRFRKDWVSFKLSDSERIAPYDALHRAEAERGSFDKIYRAGSSMSAPNLYYCIFRNERNERCIVFFEVIRKSLRMIKTYFPATVMTNLPE
jgi:hypothetical protein